MSDKKPRERKCRSCREPYQPWNSLQNACSLECALQLARKELDKKRREEEKVRKRDLKKKKEEFKTVNQWVKEVQPEFNRYIRLRDWDKPCISCDRAKVEMVHGGQWDCGHYLSVGAFPELRFEEDNAHKQCKSCNSGSYHHVKKGSTVKAGYREKLIERIGLEKVEWLEGPHPPACYTIDDLKEIKKHYKIKQKEMLRLIEETQDERN